MNEMVERVAKALIDDDPTMFGHHESHIKAKESAARAAIASMREPTRVMVDVGVKTLGAEFKVREDIEDIWQDMIGEALAER
jgi:hypothetical protein